MGMSNTKAITAALVLGLGVAGVTTPAQAALDEAVLATIQAPEVAEVAVGIAAVLDGMGPEVDEQAITAALHDYLSASIFGENVVMDGLAVVLGGDWSDMQFAALRSLFSRYVAGDVEPPRGGAEALMIDGAADLGPAADRLEALTPSAIAPTGGVLSNQAVEDEGDVAPPPPPSGAGGSDYTL